MVENRKLFYAISVVLLSCCQIITMFPHNAAMGPGGTNTVNNSGNSNASPSSVSDNSAYNRANVDSSSNQSFGTADDDSEFIVAVERKLQTMESHNEGLIQGNVGVWETSPDSIASENVDDLIFLDKRPINHHQQQPHREYVAQLPPRPSEQLHRHQHFEIHHHLSADGLNSGSSSSSTSDENSSDSLTHTTFASSSSSSLSSLSSSTYSDKASQDAIDDDVGDGATDVEPDADVAMPPHEIDLQPENNEELSGATMVVAPLDLSDFLSLIPADRVKAIVAHYYHNDPEVQRAHAFMSSRDFIALKHHIIAVPEMSAFLRYLNSSGLDLVKFVTTLTNMTKVPPPTTAAEKGSMAKNATTTNETNDIEYAQQESKTMPSKTATNPEPTTNIEIQTQPTTPPPPSAFASASESAAGPEAAETMSAATIDMETTTVKEQLNGLHGLVDSILDVLPQDLILATFFDKLESSEQFSKLVDNIGSPEFSKILNNMQQSVPLRNLIFTLHNNGIYVIRIVDSLKSYFFLGGF